MLWGFVGGVALLVLGFIDPERERVTRRVAAVVSLGVGVLGLVAMSRLAGPDLTGGPFHGLFLTAGGVAMAASLALWRTVGWRQPLWVLLLVGVVCVVLWLVVPLGGRVPVAYLASLFQRSGVPVAWRWATLAGFLLPLAVCALAVLFVGVRRREATPGQLRSVFWLATLLLPVVHLLQGFGAMFTTAWAFLAFLHYAMWTAAWGTIVTVAVVALPREARSGEDEEDADDADTPPETPAADVEPAPAPLPVEPHEPTSSDGADDPDELDDDWGYRKSE